MKPVRCVHCGGIAIASSAPFANVASFRCEDCKREMTRYIPQLPGHRLPPLQPSERSIPKG